MKFFLFLLIILLTSCGKKNDKNDKNDLIYKNDIKIVKHGININKCTPCHGKKFQKHALKQSKIVNNMTHRDIAKALKGYKNNTYGGELKKIMKAQINNYSDADLEAFAQTIGK